MKTITAQSNPEQVKHNFKSTSLFHNNRTDNRKSFIRNRRLTGYDKKTNTEEFVFKGN